jgi:uncharacterized membrane protein
MSDSDSEFDNVSTAASLAGRPEVSRGARAAAVSAALAIAYALSPAPAMILLERFAASFSADELDRIVGAAYAPLIYLSNEIPAVEGFYIWYLGLFGH